MILSFSLLISFIARQNINILLGFIANILAKDIEAFKNDLSLISKKIKNIADDKKMIVKSIIFIALNEKQNLYLNNHLVEFCKDQSLLVQVPAQQFQLFQMELMNM